MTNGHTLETVRILRQLGEQWISVSDLIQWLRSDPHANASSVAYTIEKRVNQW